MPTVTQQTEEKKNGTAGSPRPPKLHPPLEERQLKKWELPLSMRRGLHRMACLGVILQYRLGRRARLWLDRLEHIAHELEWAEYLANLLYLMGFWTEYALRRTGHFLHEAGLFVAQKLRLATTLVVDPTLRVIQHAIHDFTAPFVRFITGMHNIRTLMGQQRAARGRVSPKEVVLYWLRGTLNYLPLVWGMLVHILPFAAAAVLCLTVQTVLNYNYVLAVQVDGNVVGYVPSEQVFDSAKEDIQERINQAKMAMQASESAENVNQEWSIEPSFVLAVNDDVMDEGQMADAVLRASSSQIQEATALYIDNSLRAVTTEGDRLQNYLDQIKAPYEDPDNTNLRVEFVRSVELVDGIYFTDSITPYNSITEMLSGKQQEAVSYAVKSGDTPWSIAAGNGLTLNELYALNPQMTESGYNMYVGDELLVSQEQEMLQVKQVVTTTWQETIKHDTITTESDDYNWGITKVLSEGSDGLKEITADITYINGVETSVDYLNERVLVEPVTAETVKGTKLPNGMIAAYGSGTWVWPVPNYKYVSRWMSSYHNGADICAGYGAPILASDGGVVVTAGWHYSYGNYVIIDHGNGYRTLYAHASSLLVSVGQAVKQGQQIACVGSTGNSTGNHCHFEMYYNGVRFSAATVFGGM